MIGILAVLGGIVMAVVNRGRRAAMAVNCLAQLRQLSVALIQYSDTNGNRFPDPYSSGVSWEQMLRPYLPQGGVFRCTADPELFSALGSSYDWRDTGRSETTLTGRARTDCTRPEAVVVFDALPGWHSAGMMNAALFDGSARPMDTNQCLSDLQRPIRPR